MSEQPKNRPWEPEDPLHLNAATVEGNPEIMLACLVEEYARMGMNRQQIQELFDRPFFRATHGLKLLFGEGGLQKRIGQILGRCGVLRVQTQTPPGALGSRTRCPGHGITARPASPGADASRRTE